TMAECHHCVRYEHEHRAASDDVVRPGRRRDPGSAGPSAAFRARTRTAAWRLRVVGFLPPDRVAADRPQRPRAHREGPGRFGASAAPQYGYRAVSGPAQTYDAARARPAPATRTDRQPPTTPPAHPDQTEDPPTARAPSDGPVTDGYPHHPRPRSGDGRTHS